MNALSTKCLAGHGGRHHVCHCPIQGRRVKKMFPWEKVNKSDGLTSTDLSTTMVIGGPTKHYFSFYYFIFG